MVLSWNEIKDRALLFSREWADTCNEEAEAQPFLEAFFHVFGTSRKKIATFEHKVKKLDEHDGYIDLLWKGTILIEMKSRGKNLDKAYQQVRDYLYGLKQYELPRYVLVSDFETFRLYDLEEGDGETKIEFKLADLMYNVQHFGYLIGYQKKVYKEQDPANIRAAELMGKLHDRLKEIGYEGHPLEVYLVRLLFCLFAEDTTIFDKEQFQDYIFYRSQEDGSDLAALLQELFQVLNTANDKRYKNIDEQLDRFPYVNGKLFEEVLPTASFDAKMRQTLLECCRIDWSKISPAIFGSMFQSVMNPKERRNLGAHYTSETNILKLIKPLFLDALWEEFEGKKNNRQKLNEFHLKLKNLHFLDPACGCGNFLIITYRELRLLEMEILRALNKTGQTFISIENVLLLNVDMMCGIEYEEFPARIAEVAMWLMDHQMNMLVSQEFGQYFVRLPLLKSANIVHGDALDVYWQHLLNPVNSYTISADHANIIYAVHEPEVPYGTVNVYVNTASVKTVEQIKEEEHTNVLFDYILGNPPFIGAKVMTQPQRDSIVSLFGNIPGSGVLDYVTGWYIKAARYIHNTTTKVAFVSTNSIVQGEQVSILWERMLNKYGIKIHFAHRTFKWSNEARGNAAVYCVIVGFANYDSSNKQIFEYDNIQGEAHAILAKNINPYLVDAKDIFITKRSSPISPVPAMSFGNMPLDGGHLLLTDADKLDLLAKEPQAEAYIKPLISAKEFLHGQQRWCLWLADVNPTLLRQMPEVMKRVALVKQFRLESIRQQTRDRANCPTLFGEIRDFGDTFIVVPRVSSENRKYIPMGFFDRNSIVSDTCMAIPNASLYHFGVLTSAMHTAWLGAVCGRLKSDFRYSKDIVYNNYPWPQQVSNKQVQAIEQAAQKVLDLRATFPTSSLADLYDPLAMPAILVKAHDALDRAVDLSYRTQAFTSAANRLVFLFNLYEEQTANLFSQPKTKKTKKK